ncbi:serine protease AprX [Hydrogenispora ethanolica]|jgi:serine protease AprX|uniref:Serine protease AprX n=1 Tax=Hydrogenispora ethanolica TaxID=1082276 RepID=A0A4R1RXL2_HYDET|nr:S8 family serine peptidase [Hydrogenispora ethanolica]TCL70920.1 serine protease AprX [Hydrogenispora ethanolica]
MFSGYNWEEKLSPALRRATATSNERCRIIVEIADHNPNMVAAIVAQHHGRVVREIGLLSSWVVEVPRSALPQLAQLKQVKKIWDDPEVKTKSLGMSPPVREIPSLGFGLTGKGVTVAILDTGIAAHPDLSGPENPIVGWVDLVQQRPAPYDDHGHGTHMAGIIAGNGRSSRGKWTGLAPNAKLVGVKVLNRRGIGSMATLVAGVEWCIRNQALYQIRLINLSCGATPAADADWGPLRQALNWAWRKGIIVCCAWNDNPGWNGSIKGIRVGTNPLIQSDLILPEMAVTSLRPLQGYRTFSGASVATALATGMAAQILEQWPYLGPGQVKLLLSKHIGKIDWTAGPTERLDRQFRTPAIPNWMSTTIGGAGESLARMASQIVAAGTAAGEGYLWINPFSLFLILILLIFSFTSPDPKTNPFVYFLILILLIFSFEPRLALIES